MAAEKMSIDSKPNQSRKNDSDDSAASSPDREHQSSGVVAVHAQEPPQPKRKGGRKPIYATSEERKQRNRQAQAAFRERRTEYIKQLEETIQIHESNLHSLQTAHRTAADECLMLRYKNSLLERILLEKGIDVHAELHAKTGSPTLGPTHMPQNLVQPPTIQRAIGNRNSRKSVSAIAPKTDFSLGLGVMHLSKSDVASKRRPAPSNNAGSPSNAGSGVSPAGSDNFSIRSSVSGLPKQQLTPMSSATSGSTQAVSQTGHSQTRSGALPTGGSLYTNQAFHSHLDHLDEDYDVQDEMIDDSELEPSSGVGNYHHGFGGEGSHPMLLSPTSSHSVHQTSGSTHTFPTMTQLMDHSLDWDPFGLSASMAFPTAPFQFEQGHMR